MSNQLKAIKCVLTLLLCSCVSIAETSNKSPEKADVVKDSGTSLTISSGDKKPGVIRAEKECGDEQDPLENHSSEVEVGLAISLPFRSGDQTKLNERARIYSRYHCAESKSQ